MYHPTLSRWLSRDPLGYIDGPNLYGYCGNAPGAFTDPWGLQSRVVVFSQEPPSKLVGLDGKEVFCEIDEEGNVYRVRKITTPQEFRQWADSTKWLVSSNAWADAMLRLHSGAGGLWVPEEEADPALTRAMAMSCYAREAVGPEGFRQARALMPQLFPHCTAAAMWAQEARTTWGFALRVALAGVLLGTLETFDDMMEDDEPAAPEPDTGNDAPGGGRRSNPLEGEPGSTERTTKPDGSPKQTRKYGKDGWPERDVDRGHDHGAGDPHVHDWGRPADGSEPTDEDRGSGRPPRPGEIEELEK